jgi:two-component sensor histidine kinase/PAS domain-containing protein
MTGGVERLTSDDARERPSEGAEGKPLAFPLDEQHFREMLGGVANSGLMLLYRADTRRPELWWSPGSARLLGYEPAELAPTLEAFHALIHPHDVRLAQDRIPEVYDPARGTAASCEFRVRRKDGSYLRVRSILSACRATREGAVTASVEVIRVLDNERLHERAALKLSELALSTVLNEIGYPVVLMDSDGIIVQANDAALRFSGTSAAADRFCPFLHRDDGQLLFTGFLEDVIRLGQPASRELERFQRWWHIHLVPIRDAEHRVARILLLAQDTTVIKAEQAVQLRRERALTRTLIREIHHRIKNHLQGLVGLLRRHASAEVTSSQLVDSAVAQIQSIAAMHGLLARSGKTSLDPGSLVADIVAAHQVASPIPLHLNLQPTGNAPVELSEGEAIPAAVAIGELLINAIKHTRRAPDAQVRIGVVHGPDQVEVTIANSPAHLPAGFHLDAWLGGQSGLALVLTLLSDGRSRLRLGQEGDAVVTRLTFQSVYAASIRH